MYKLSIVVAPILSMVLSGGAYAVPTSNDNLGSWVDDYQDSIGIDFDNSERVVHDAIGQLVKLAAGETQGHVTTGIIQPASFSSWKAIYLKFSATHPNDIKVQFLPEVGAPINLPVIGTSDETAWQGKIDLAAVPSITAAAYPRGKLRVILQNSTGTVAPTLQALRIDWVPLSVVKVTIESGAEACSYQAIPSKLRISVSHVDATNLVAWLPLPQGTYTVAPGLNPTDTRLTLIEASDGGTYWAGPNPLVIGNTSVPANSVYWSLGTRKAGNTFLVSFSLRSPAGVLNNTSYQYQGSARSSNSGLAQTAVNTFTVKGNGLSRQISKSAYPVYNLFGQNWVNAGQNLNYSLSVGNYNNSGVQCLENWQRVIVWDELDQIKVGSTRAFVGNPQNISGDGQYTGTVPKTFHVTNASDGTLQTITVPANSVYWDIGTLPAGQSRSFSFSLTLAGNGPLVDNTLLRNTLHYESGFVPHRTLGTAIYDVKSGVPVTPSGNLAKGDRIRGSGSVSGGEDNSQLTAEYGEQMAWLLSISNTSASAITNIVMLDKIPAGMKFVNSFIPNSDVNIRYYNTLDTAYDNPPDFNVNTGVLGPSWTTTAPSVVRWVAFKVQRIASTYFPEAGVPTGITAEVNVTIDANVGDQCATKTITNYGHIYSYGWQSQLTGATGTDRLSMVSQAESVVVKPSVPNLGPSSASASPSTVTGAREVDMYFNVYNYNQGAASTDSALTVVAVVTLPTIELGGLIKPIEIVEIVAPGATLLQYDTPAANQLTVSYASISPNETKQIRVRVKVPKGMVDNSSFRLTGTVTGQDNLCGPTSGGGQANVTVRVNPYLQVTKSTSLAVAAKGSTFDYQIGYLNSGDGASTQSWIVDRVPANVTFQSALVPTRGETYWFSAQSSPADVRVDPFTLTDTNIRQTFSKGIAGPNGTIVAPFAADTVKWIAVNVDDSRLTKPQLTTTETGIPDKLTIKVKVRDTASNGATISNESAVFSKELVLAISNQALTVISSNPSLAVERVCSDVVANGESFDVDLKFTNNSSNQDNTVEISEAIPAGVVFEGVTKTTPLGTNTTLANITWDPPLDEDPNEDGSRRIVWAAAGPTSEIGGPLGSLQSIRLQIHLHMAGISSGTFVPFSGIGAATNTQLPQGVTVFSQCQVPVQNSDLWLRTLVDQTSPLDGEEVTYTLLLSNQGLHDGNGLELDVTLPPEVDYVCGSAVVATSGWALSGNKFPVRASDGSAVCPDGTERNGKLIWRVAAGNALVKAPKAAGYMPGSSGDITIRFKVKLKALVGPNKTLPMCANTRLTPDGFEDLNFANQSCIEVRTPQPDPYIEKTAPAVAQRGSSITYQLRYGNKSRMPARRVVLFDALYDHVVNPDGVADVTLLSATGGNASDVIFYSSLLIGDRPPPFDYDSVQPTGWTRDLESLSGPANWVAIKVGDLAGLQSPRTATLNVELRSKITTLTPEPGTSIINCAELSIFDPLGQADDDTTNNESCATTKTPGIDLTMVQDCSPKGGFPGVRPGEQVTLELKLVNSGTQPAHGLAIVDDYPDWFEPESDTATTVQTVDASGVASVPVNLVESPINDPVPWTRLEDRWILGSPQATNPYYYRRVGLAPGHATSIQVSGRVKLTVGNNTPADNVAIAVTDYREGWHTGDPVEENTANNSSTCGTVVYRPDPFVLKFAADTSGGQGPVGVGDRIQYQIAYNNVGGAVGDTVVLEDILPTGTRFVAGSLSNVPDDAVAEWLDPDGAWQAFTDLPVANGTATELVTAIRVRWDEMRAPSNNYFNQTTAVDFARGTFVGTTVDAESQAVISGGSVPNGTRRTYTTPVIPSENEGRIVTWDRVIVNGRGALFVDVIDGLTGEVVEGLENIDADESTAIDISNLDPNVVGTLKLRASFSGASTSGGAPAAPTFFSAPGFSAPSIGDGSVDDPELAHVNGITPLSLSFVPYGHTARGEIYGPITQPYAGTYYDVGIARRVNGIWQIDTVAVPGKPGNLNTPWAYVDEDHFAFQTYNSKLATGQYQLMMATRDGAGTWSIAVIDSSSSSSFSVRDNAGGALLGTKYYPNAGSRATVWVRNVQAATGWDAINLPSSNANSNNQPIEMNSNGVIVGTIGNPNTIGLWVPSGNTWVQATATLPTADPVHLDPLLRS